MATKKEKLAAELYCHTGVALRELAHGYYQGIKLESVRQFQIKWGEIYPLIVNDPSYHRPVLGAGWIVNSNEDGGATKTGRPRVTGYYGPATAICMDTFVAQAFMRQSRQISYQTDAFGNKRILPRVARGDAILPWYIQNKAVIDNMCPTGQPEYPVAPKPDPGPIPPIGPPMPPPLPFVIPDPPPPPKPAPVNLKAIAINMRNKCTKGFPNVFKHKVSGKLAWVKDGAFQKALRKHPEWVFVRKQAVCKQPGTYIAPSTDRTKIIAGIGLAIFGAGAFLFWRKKKKKKKKKKRR